MSTVNLVLVAPLTYENKARTQFQFSTENAWPK